MYSVFLISGCASPPLAVTYYSNPPGAVIYDSVTGVRHGYTPVTLNYTVAKEERQRGYKTINGTTAKWTSGASASGRDMVNLDLNRYGFNQQITFQRPDDASGLGEDMKFASDLNNQRMQQLQLQQQRQACANRTTPSNGGLFGPTPDEVRQQRIRDMQESSYKSAKLDPFESASQSMRQAGATLGGVAMQMAGFSNGCD